MLTKDIRNTDLADLRPLLALWYKNTVSHLYFETKRDEALNPSPVETLKCHAEEIVSISCDRKLY